MKKIFGAPSWRVAAKDVEAFVTQVGGHLGPVTFDRRGRKLRPYSVAPWFGEKQPRGLPPMLRVLRGDFFCLPFGGNAVPFRGERHPPHGETANGRWKLESEGPGLLHLSLAPRVRPGRVDQRIVLRDGHNAVYVQHAISGMRGPMNLGHHAMLKFPDEPGSGVLSTSRFAYGQVFPGAFETPAARGYQSLAPGAEFDSLERVPMIGGGLADLTRFPARRGYDDLVMLVSRAEAAFAWTAVTFPQQRYVWFALRDPRVLRETNIWISNGGRHYPPWSGRHASVMGLEDATSYFHEGLAESARRNPISEKGFPTCLQLDPWRVTVVNYIMAVASLPPGFDRVGTIEPAAEGEAVTLRSSAGKAVTVPLDVAFLKSGPAGTHAS
jgi:hypothetical protein